MFRQARTPILLLAVLAGAYSDNAHVTTSSTAAGDTTTSAGTIPSVVEASNETAATRAVTLGAFSISPMYWMSYRCEERFSADLLAYLRQSVAAQIPSSEPSFQNEVDSISILTALTRQIELLDSTIFNLTSSYHHGCATSMNRGPAYCLQLRSLWVTQVQAARDELVNAVCERIELIGLAKSNWQICNFSNSYSRFTDMRRFVARLLRCEARCRFYPYTNEPICIGFQY